MSDPLGTVTVIFNCSATSILNTDANSVIKLYELFIQEEDQPWTNVRSTYQHRFFSTKNRILWFSNFRLKNMRMSLFLGVLTILVSFRPDLKTWMHPRWSEQMDFWTCFLISFDFSVAVELVAQHIQDIIWRRKAASKNGSPFTRSRSNSDSSVLNR